LLDLAKKGMPDKLNEQFFKTRKIYRENYTRKKLSFKRKLFNILVAFILVFIIDSLYKNCQRKISENNNLSIVERTVPIKFTYIISFFD